VPSTSSSQGLTSNSKESRILAGGETLGEQGVELVELRVQGVVVGEPGGTFHLTDDRAKRAVGVLRRAEIAQPCVWLAGETFE
jgi:hypothetical protein